MSTPNQILSNISTPTGAETVAQATGSGVANCRLGDTFRANGDGLSVKQCTIAQGVTGAGSYTLDHDFITSDGDGIDPTGPGSKVIEYSKIWRDGTRVGVKHQDGIQFWQGGNTLIARNWISGWQTSAIMIKSDKGSISHITIDSNYLDNPTGYYQLYICDAAYGAPTYITVTNNAFGKAGFTTSTCSNNVTFVHTEAQRQAAITAGNASAAAWVVWNNNYLAGTTTVVAPPGGWTE